MILITIITIWYQLLWYQCINYYDNSMISVTITVWYHLVW